MERIDLFNLLSIAGCSNYDGNTSYDTYAETTASSFFAEQVHNRNSAGWKKANYIIVNNVDVDQIKGILGGWHNLASRYGDQYLLVKYINGPWTMYDSNGDKCGEDEFIKVFFQQKLLQKELMIQNHNTISELFASYLKNVEKSEATIDKYVKQVPNNREVQNILQSIAGTTELFDVMDIVKLRQISQKVASQDFDQKGGNMYSAGIKAYIHFISNYCLFVKYIAKGNKNTFENKSNPNCERSLQQIFYGAPGTGKSHKVKEVTDKLPKSDVFRTTFHPDSDYATFVGCYKPKMVKAPIRDGSGHEITSACEDEKKRIAYEYEPQAFLKAYIRAYETREPVFLVIEEINRGNCAQIFGDMFQLLDRNENGESDYAIKPETAIQEFLYEKLSDCDIEDDTIKSGEEMRLPANLHIWATMNTSDQSLFPIDSAFKRRWDWKYVPINTHKENWRIAVNGKLYSWSSFLDKINYEIDDTTHSEDKKLGFYFCKAVDGVISAERFVGKVLFYLYNDVFKDYNFAREFFKDANGKIIPFQMFFNCTDGSTNDNAVEMILKNLHVDLIENVVDGDSAAGTLNAPEDEMLDDDGNTPSSSTRDYSKYSINHEGRYDKRSLAKNTILTFINQHAELPDDEIITKWKSLNVFNKFVLTESEYNRELDSSSDRSGRQSRFFDFELPNSHTHMYVYNQFDVGSIEAFINKVNAQDWGIHLEKIE